MTKYDLKLRPIHYACVSGGERQFIYVKFNIAQS